MLGVARRSYGTGRLYVVVDCGGRASWYGSWWVGGTRVKRKVGLKRTPGNADGLTRTQAERVLRRLVDATTVVAKGQRRTIGEAGDAYVAHLENVMERKRTTIADYRGYLRRHLAPFFGDRPMDRIEAAEVERYLHAKRDAGLSAKTVQNHLNFLHGVFAFSFRRGWVTANPVALVERPRVHRSAHRRIRFLQPEELEAVLRAVPADDFGAIERPLYLTAAMTGLRQGELLALRWSDVDWAAGRVRVAESFTRGAFDSPTGVTAPIHATRQRNVHTSARRLMGERSAQMTAYRCGNPSGPACVGRWLALRSLTACCGIAETASPSGTGAAVPEPNARCANAAPPVGSGA
jgi:integrase